MWGTSGWARLKLEKYFYLYSFKLGKSVSIHPSCPDFTPTDGNSYDKKYWQLKLSQRIFDLNFPSYLSVLELFVAYVAGKHLHGVRSIVM